MKRDDQGPQIDPQEGAPPHEGGAGDVQSTAGAPEADSGDATAPAAADSSTPAPTSIPGPEVPPRMAGAPNPAPDIIAPVATSSFAGTGADQIDTSPADVDRAPSSALPDAVVQEDVTAETADDAAPPAGYVAPLTPGGDVVALPTQPPAAPRERGRQLLPIAGPGAAQDEPSPAEKIFPPNWPLHYPSAPPRPGDPNDPGRQSAAPGAAAEGASADAVAVPRVQVLVSLAGAQAALEAVVIEAAAKMAPQFQELAGLEVRHAAWVRKCEERAADYTLRGPQPR